MSGRRASKAVLSTLRPPTPSNSNLWMDVCRKEIKDRGEVSCCPISLNYPQYPDFLKHHLELPSCSDALQIVCRVLHV